MASRDIGEFAARQSRDDTGESLDIDLIVGGRDESPVEIRCQKSSPDTNTSKAKLSELRRDRILEYLTNSGP